MSLTRDHALGLPPGMIEGPLRAPSSPPETPVPIYKRPFSSRYFVRRIVSIKKEFPPSMMQSPEEHRGTSWSIASSTGWPAFTMSIIFRGVFKRPIISSIEWAPMTFDPFAAWLRNSSTLDTVRLNATTVYPLSFMFIIRFWPMTARPINAISPLGSIL